MERPDVRAVLARVQEALGPGWIVEVLCRSVGATEHGSSPPAVVAAAAQRLADALGARVRRSRHCTGLAGEVLIWRPSDYYGPAMLVAWEVLP